MVPRPSEGAPDGSSVAPEEQPAIDARAHRGTEDVRLPSIPEEAPHATDPGLSTELEEDEVEQVLQPPSPSPSVLSVKRPLGAAHWNFDRVKSPRLENAVSCVAERWKRGSLADVVYVVGVC